MIKTEGEALSRRRGFILNQRLLDYMLWSAERTDERDNKLYTELPKKILVSDSLQGSTQFPPASPAWSTSSSLQETIVDMPCYDPFVSKVFSRAHFYMSGTSTIIIADDDQDGIDELEVEFLVRDVFQMEAASRKRAAFDSPVATPNSKRLRVQ
jgi:hypothetical protein